ncbi:MAG TPA: hypothetical protein VK698_18985 [Kofleriaceae bacterium]|nr:hypothetical protein [Kofleriaceae bacterium]
MPDQAQESDRQKDELGPQQQAESKEGAPRVANEEIRAEDRSHFFAVANALIGAMHTQSPQLQLPDRLTRKEGDAVRLIYEARTAQESEYGGGTISGLERMRYLNEGLLALQGTLAIAKSSFPQARSHIEEIRRLIAKLKEQIAQAIVAEERKKQQEKAKKDLDTKQADEQAKAKKTAEDQTKKA